MMLSTVVSLGEPQRVRVNGRLGCVIAHLSLPRRAELSTGAIGFGSHRATDTMTTGPSASPTARRLPRTAMDNGRGVTLSPRLRWSSVSHPVHP